MTHHTKCTNQQLNLLTHNNTLINLSIQINLHTQTNLSIQISQFTLINNLIIINDSIQSFLVLHPMTINIL